MSFIRFTTTKILTLNQELALKKMVESLITNVVGENRYHLMIHIEDNQVMYYQGKAEDCMLIDCHVHIDNNEEKDIFVESIKKEVESITKIPITRQYLIIGER